jgi:hypothetical protein
MEIPQIVIRRSNKIAFGMLAFGVVIAGLGLVFSFFWIIFLGVMPMLLAGLVLLNPMVVLATDHVALKNIFGLTRASYDHDGLHLVQVIDDMIYIQKGDMRAPLRRIVKRRLHPGDWQVMLERLEIVRQMHAAQAKSKGKH